MTATRIGRLATVVVLTAGWLLAAAFLWRTSVPSGIDVKGVDPRQFFSARELARAARYQRLANTLRVLEVAAELAALAILARRGPRLGRTIELGRVGTGVVLAALVFVTLWLVSLPFGLAARWWEARHGLAPHAYVSWLAADVPLLTLDVLAGLGAVALVLWLSGRLRERWWLAGAPAFAGAAVAFVFVSGFVSQLGTHAPRSTTLRADIRSLERTEGVTGTPVHVDEVGDVTREANAFADGFGPSANVVLWSTLLDGRFTRREIRVVLAHELGHVAHRHVLKALGWTALVALPVAWLLTALARLRGGIGDPGSVPFALLALTVLALLAAPLENVASRRYEAEADWSALQATHDPASTRRLFVDFARTSLQQPNPPTWDYLWLENHPTVAQRLAMVEAWARSRTAARRSPAGS